MMMTVKLMVVMGKRRRARSPTNPLTLRQWGHQPEPPALFFDDHQDGVFGNRDKDFETPSGKNLHITLNIILRIVFGLPFALWHWNVWKVKMTHCLIQKAQFWDPGNQWDLVPDRSSGQQQGMDCQSSSIAHLGRVYGVSGTVQQYMEYSVSTTGVQTPKIA